MVGLKPNGTSKTKMASIQSLLMKCTLDCYACIYLLGHGYLMGCFLHVLIRDYLISHFLDQIEAVDQNKTHTCN